MPVDFLTSDQKQNYGCYAAEPNDVQLARYFILMNGIWPSLTNDGANIIGWALRFSSPQPVSGTFLTDLTQVLPGVQHFVAVQLNIHVQKFSPAMLNGTLPLENILH